MTQTVSEIMTADPRTCEMDAPITDVARLMRDEGIGSVIAVDGGSVKGIVTDRDIVVRGIAERPSGDLHVSDVCTGSPVMLSPQDSVDEAIRLVRQEKVRRIPVVEGDRPVGILSSGDLAIERDAGSALGEISDTPQNNT